MEGIGPRNGATGSRRTAVYRLYGHDGELVYVGMTVNIERRLADHERGSFWWPHVARTAVVWYDTRPEADAAESEAVAAEKPLYNMRKQAPGPVAGAPPAGAAPWDAPLLVAAQLRRDIFAGKYPAGYRLGHNAVATVFGTGPQTVRRVLRTLASERLLIVETRGTFVRALRLYAVRADVPQELATEWVAQEEARLKRFPWTERSPAVREARASYGGSGWNLDLTVSGPDAGAAAAAALDALKGALPACDIASAAVAAKPAAPGR